MKKILLGLFAYLSLFITACNLNSSDGKSETKNETRNQNNVTIELKENSWAFIAYDLSEFADKSVSIDFSCEMKVTNNSNDTANLKWQLTLSDYPVLLSKDFAPGTSEWIKVSSSEKEKSKTYELGSNTQLYLSTYQLDVTKFKIELKNIKYTVTYEEASNQDDSKKNWLDDDVPSLKDTYSDIFNSFGLACEYASWSGVNELSVESVRDGLSKHANSITMGNEFKPDSLFGYQWSGAGCAMEDFLASNGYTIKVPEKLNFVTVDNCLAAAKQADLQMRGHVLVWHSQTPDNFFAENYVAKIENDLITNKVSKEVMTARQEWYIKKVLEHVSEWEEENNDGKHIIWAWDVVNEAMADDAGNTYSGDNQNWLRGSTAETKNKKPSDKGSRWYQIYENDDFIVNAFRFANAYAPSDVKLCYNDYNEYMNYDKGWKTDAILHIISNIQNGEEQTINGNSVKPRIDAMGMQSHLGISWPGVKSYEDALKKYLAVVDVHVTELDFSATSKSDAKSAYSETFKMLKKYGKNYSGDHQITNVTLWGINNSTSWIYKNDVKYPLLFDKFTTTDSFWAVIDAAND